MSNTDRLFDVDYKNQGEHIVTIAPTHDAATSQAHALIHHFRQEPALLARFVAAVNNTHGDHSGTRHATVQRLARVLATIGEAELSVPEADVLADDIHDAMVTPPECETDGCSQPQHHQGLCWDHLNARDARVREAIATAPALIAKAERVLGGAL